jgi:hypothetical protein
MNNPTHLGDDVHGLLQKDLQKNVLRGILGMNKDDDVIICRVAGMVNARIILGRLQADGISARLQYDAIGTILYSLIILGTVLFIDNFPIVFPVAFNN